VDRHSKTVSGMRRKNGEAERGNQTGPPKKKKYPRYARYIQRKRNRSIGRVDKWKEEKNIMRGVKKKERQ